MTRILALLAFAVALIFGLGGHVPAGAAPVPGKGLLVWEALNASAPGEAQQDEDDCPSAGACCHSSPSPAFMVDRNDLSPRSGDRSKSAQLAECELRSIVLTRDPPIPKPLI